MNRRGFLKTLTGALAAAAIPMQWALRAPEFRIVTDNNEQRIIDLLTAKIRAAEVHMKQIFEESLYSYPTG